MKKQAKLPPTTIVPPTQQEPPQSVLPAKRHNESPHGARAPLPVQSEGPSIFEQVSNQAANLGYDAPTYIVREEEDRPGFYRGYPEFKNRGIPEGIIGVRSVYGKKMAKTKIAELVLDYFQRDRARRERLLRAAQEQMRAAQEQMAAAGMDVEDDDEEE